MSSEYSGETASAASASWSWWTLCVFTSGIFFGTVIAGMFLYRKSSLQAKFRALLGCLLPSTHSHPSPAGHQDTASEQPMDSDIIQGSPSGQEGAAPTHPLEPNIVRGTPSSQEDSTSTSTHLQSRPPSPQRGYKYDVFLSFRDTDPGNKFIDNLCRCLDREQISTFKNGKRLEEGEPISPDLLQAIRDSKIFIVVFSRDYAASTRCLEEMAAIVDCQKEFEQVFPVFYDVDPSDVRNQSGMYENAFILHTQKFKEDPGKVDRWKTAMTCLGNLSGLGTRDKPEHIVIENITRWLLKALVHKFSRSADDLVGIQPFLKFSRSADDLVGIQPCVEELEKHLKLSWEDDSFRILGICGMGGVGKTTYTMALCGKIFHQFDACCFIQNVSQIYRGGGVVAVQKQILSQSSNEQNLEIFDPFEISRAIRKMLSSKRLLIVLDDVDELEQLEKLAISPKLLGSGSRIIIITRDEHVLKVYGADIIYKVPLLNDNDAHELFLRKAFNSKIPDDNNYVQLIPKILEYAQNLPIAIKVLGSFLREKDVIHWENVLERKRNFPIIEETFQKSFEELRPNEKEIFLHIACFFHGGKEESVKQVLDSCGLYSHTGIQAIKDKSLIIIKYGEIHMHEMLQELGRKIVKAKCPEKPGSWSRLWLCKDFESVLMLEMGTNNVKAIVLNEKEDISKCAQLRIEGLSKMGDLQLLILHHINFSGELTHLPNNLRYLLWHGYPFSSLPLFEPYSRLVELNLPNSSVERLWKGHKTFPYLERVDLSNSKNLMETPNFEGCPNLQRLNFTGCTNLKLVDSSIGLLTKLKFLLLKGCTNLDEMPESIYNLTSLAALDISGCKILGNLKGTKFKEINQQEHGLFNLSLHLQPNSAIAAAPKSSPSLPKPKSSPSLPKPLPSLADHHQHKMQISQKHSTAAGVHLYHQPVQGIVPYNYYQILHSNSCHDIHDSSCQETAVSFESCKKQYFNLESSPASSVLIGYNSLSHAYVSSNRSTFSPQGSQSYYSEQHQSSDNNYGSPISGCSSVDDGNEWKHKLKELENSLLGPESDNIVDSCHRCFKGAHQGATPMSKYNWDQIAEMIPKFDLREVLTLCAQAIADEDYQTAIGWMDNVLVKMVSVAGDPIQRLGAYMLEGLRARLESSGSQIYEALKCEQPTSKDLMTCMHVLYQICPYWKFAYISANVVIGEAMENEPRIHIIDFQIAQGIQWFLLIQALASRPGGPPFIRVTGVDDSQSNHARGGGLHIVGKRLSDYAKSCSVPFEFHSAAMCGCDVKRENLVIHPGEALAVNFPFVLNHMPDESVSTENRRDRLLRLVKSLSPRVVTLVEQESNTNTSPFFQRFVETLNYYTAMFESIDVARPRDDKQRISAEQHCMARDIVNMMACEGAERVERHELLGKWRSRFLMSGFAPCPLSPSVRAAVRNLLNEFNENYWVEQRDGALYLGWKKRALSTSSAWC